MIEINRHPSIKELRVFGLLLALFALLVSGLLWFKFDSPEWARTVMLVGAVVVILYALIRPLRRPLYLGWMYAAYPIGWTISHILLALIYYGVLTPIGLALRLFGWDPMGRRFNPEAASYWEDRESAVESERYFKQF